MTCLQIHGGQWPFTWSDFLKDQFPPENLAFKTEESFPDWGERAASMLGEKTVGLSGSMVCQKEQMKLPWWQKTEILRDQGHRLRRKYFRTKRQSSMLLQSQVALIPALPSAGSL